MPGSYPTYKRELKSYIAGRFPDRSASILDVGCGRGTYQELLGDEYGNIDGVEVFLPYIEKYGLRTKYRRLWEVDVRGFDFHQGWDLIVFGDVLEHLGVKDAQSVLARAIVKCTEVVVAVPFMYKQGACDNNVHEIHLQDDLTPEIMAARYPCLKTLLADAGYGYYVKT